MKKEAVENFAAEEEKTLFENREISWLKFNERVLSEASAPENPLGERLNFLSIFQSNLDEFYMVRVGALYDRMVLDDTERENKTHLHPSEQLKLIGKAVKKLMKQHRKIVKKTLAELSDLGFEFPEFSDLSAEEKSYADTYFETTVLPRLNPVVVGAKEAVPFLENKEMYGLCVLRREEKKDRIGIVACFAKSLPRLMRLPGAGHRFIRLEDLITEHLPALFKKYEIGEKAIVRVTRNADIGEDFVFDEELDYREQMEKLILGRTRLCPVRFEYSEKLEKKLVKKLCEKCEVNSKHAFHTYGAPDISYLMDVRELLHGREDLFYKRFTPAYPADLREGEPVIPQIEKKDILITYPYEQMDPVIALLKEAGKDETVTEIQMTLYRLAKNSRVIEALSAAAENGKAVTVLVELKARFDEENNIHWTHRLEDAGCRVFYGFGRYKVHSKLLLVTRKVGGETRYIAQVGTGNYNENTAKVYSDFSLMTCDPAIGRDIADVFSMLETGDTEIHPKKLLVSPVNLQRSVIAGIEREIEKAKAGAPAYLCFKLNGLTDKAIMEKLSEASKAGVTVDLLIRGINCLRPGVPGESEKIRAYSVVGRFLEHARVYVFGTEERERMYIASADLMTRNTLRRVEAAVPIENGELRKRIHEVLNLQLQDNVKCRVATPEGLYEKRVPGPGETPLNSQEELLRRFGKWEEDPR